MNTLSLIGIIALVAILILGFVIKLYTRHKLQDMDGIADTVVVSEKDRRNVVGYHDSQNDE
ncbi:MAG: hypothetical protein RSD88_08535 [Anaerovoracaceae bacterium]